MAAKSTVTVLNQTRGTVLAMRAKTARSFWSRFRGLMGLAGLPEGEGLVFPGVQGIHTHFMRFPIDAVFYDSSGKVVDVLHALRPWRISPYRFRAKGVVELPAGVARASHTQPGDLLVLS